jgi:hypothetical protein
VPLLTPLQTMRIWGFHHHLLCHLVPMITRLVALVLLLRLLLQRLTLCWLPYFSLSLAAGSLSSRAGSSGSHPTTDVRADVVHVPDYSGPPGHPSAAALGRQGRAPSVYDTSFNILVFLVCFASCSSGCSYASYSVRTSTTLFWSCHLSA